MVQVVEENALTGGTSIWSSMHPFLHTLPEITRNGNPFDRFRRSSLSSAVVNFFLSFNGTRYVPEVWMAKFPHYMEATPELLEALESGCKLSFFHTGVTPKIKFVTQSEVWSPKSSYSVYFIPFACTVWIAMLAAVTIMSFLVEIATITLHSRQECGPMGQVVVKFLARKLIPYFGVQTNGSSSTSSLSPQKSSMTLKVILAVWLISTASIFNIYQAAFSSEYQLHFPFTTSWRYLTELDNFSFRLLVSNDLCARYKTTRNYSAVIWAEECVANIELFPEWRIVHKIFYIKEQEAYERRNMDLVNAMSRLLANLYLLCNTEENILNHSHAKDPNTRGIVFLSYDYEFQHNWNKFRRIMDTSPDLKYANNFDVDDEFGVTFKGLMFTGGLQTKFSTRVISRFKVLISSGIYWLWEKWDRIRSSQSGLLSESREVRHNTLLGKALSFDNSGTPWLFLVQIVAWVSAMFVFAIEKLRA